ncbi:MAG: rhodanese-like domain-containing protein [Oligoflexales bacterium]
MVKEVSVEELAKLVSEGVQVVDVRETEELKDGVIEGGVHWPLSSLGLHKKEIASRRAVLFYCRSGLRSMKAAEIAEEWTGETIYSLNGGFMGYKNFQGQDDAKAEENLV